MAFRTGTDVQTLRQSYRGKCLRAQRRPNPKLILEAARNSTTGQNRPARMQSQRSSQAGASLAPSETKSLSENSSIPELPELEPDNASAPVSSDESDSESTASLSDDAASQFSATLPADTNANTGLALTELRLALNDIISSSSDGTGDITAVNTWLNDSNSAWSTQNLRHTGKLSVPEGVTEDAEALDKWLNDL